MSVYGKIILADDLSAPVYDAGEPGFPMAYKADVSILRIAAESKRYAIGTPDQYESATALGAAEGIVAAMQAIARDATASAGGGFTGLIAWPRFAFTVVYDSGTELYYGRRGFGSTMAAVAYRLRSTVAVIDALRDCVTEVRLFQRPTQLFGPGTAAVSLRCAIADAIPETGGDLIDLCDAGQEIDFNDYHGLTSAEKYVAITAEAELDAMFTRDSTYDATGKTGALFYLLMYFDAAPEEGDDQGIDAAIVPGITP